MRNFRSRIYRFEICLKDFELLLGSESVPVRSQGKYSSWHVQPRLAERGGKWRPTPFSPGSLSMRPLVTC